MNHRFGPAFLAWLCFLTVGNGFSPLANQKPGWKLQQNAAALLQATVSPEAVSTSTGEKQEKDPKKGPPFKNIMAANRAEIGEYICI